MPRPKEQEEEARRAAGGGSSSSSLSDDGEQGSSSGEEAEYEAALFGTQRTRLRWQPDARQLSIDVRQTLQNRRKLEAKFKCRLNTATGDCQYLAQVQRNMSQNVPSLARLIAAERGIELDEPPIDPERFLPGGLRTLLFRDFVLSPGARLVTPALSATAASGGEGGAPPGAALKFFATLKKQPQALYRRGAWDSLLSAKVDLELDPDAEPSAGAAGGAGVRGSVRLRVQRFNVTDKQDGQVVVGADYWRGAGGGGGGGGGPAALTPYVKVGDNSWSLRLQRGLWSFTYEM